MPLRIVRINDGITIKKSIALDLPGIGSMIAALSIVLLTHTAWHAVMGAWLLGYILNWRYQETEVYVEQE